MSAPTVTPVILGKRNFYFFAIFGINILVMLNYLKSMRVNSRHFFQRKLPLSH